MEIAIALTILLLAIGLFATEKFSPDLVALLALGAVLCVGVLGTASGWVSSDRWISLSEALSGFSNEAVVTVAAMFVLSAGLQRTGAVAGVGRVLSRVGKQPTLLLLVVMLVVAPISAFVNNTAAVAVLLPLVLGVCARHNLSASRFLIPLSFASQFGGVCTLIGTSTNLLVSSISERAGYGSFSLFEFSQLGLVMVSAGVVYLLIAGRWLLPARRSDQLVDTYQLREYVTELRVTESSPLIGKSVVESKLGERHDVQVLELLRNERKIWSPTNEPLAAGDVLLVRGKVKNLMDLHVSVGLQIAPEFELKDDTLQSAELTLVEALVSPRSRLVGHTIPESDFRWRFDAIVLALQRHGHLLREQLSQVRLSFGDALLLLTRKENVSRLRSSENLLVLGEVDAPSLRNGRALLALGILSAVVLVAAFNVMPILMSALLGCLVMVITRCVTLEEAYEAIDWKVIFLLAAILPMGMVLARSGGASWLAGHALRIVGPLGPLAVLAVLYLLTAVLTEVMSNTAAAVLLAPIAISSAVSLGVDPKPFLLAVTFAASTSFATPVGYQTNTMVYNAGRYRFSDFIKVGVPLNLIFWLLAIWLIPKFWPL